MPTEIGRTPWIDDDGSGTTGTVLNNAIKTELYNQIDTALAATDTANLPGVSVVATGGAITSLPIPSGTGDLVIFLTHATGGTIQGITPGINGQRVTIYVLGTGTFSFAQLSATCPGTHRCVNVATSAPTSIAGESGMVQYVYEGSAYQVWRMVGHEQGGWVTAPFSAANFTANTGTWTVEAGDVMICRYRLSGRTLTIAIYINTSSTAGGPNNLQIGNAAYGGFTINDSNVPALFSNRASKCLDSGGIVDAQINSYGNMIYFVKLSLAAWAASTDAVLVNGQITVEVN